MMERKLKDSGIPWIGAIPEHWEVGRIKDIYLFQTGATPPSKTEDYYDGPHLWANIGDLNGKTLMETSKRLSDAGVQSCSMNISPKGSLLYSFKLSVGQVAFCGVDMYTNEAIATFLGDESRLNFLYYVAPLFIIFNANTNIYGAPILNQELIKNAIIPVPPLGEQEAISAYLDEKCGEIDELIEVEQQMIADLESYRQSVITEAVTHGLNPGAPLRPSGIDWLGQIPIHWEMKQLRAFFSEVTLQNSNTAITEQLQFKFGTIIPKPEAVIDSDLLNTISKYTVVRPGDIIINGLNLNYDFVSFRVGKVNQIGVITSAYIALRPNVGILPKFYEYFLKGMDAKKVFHSFGTGIRCTLTFKELKRKYIPFVPYKEQEAIADYLDAKCAEIAELIKVKQDKIEALRQYRQSLIFEAVTGKINIA